MTNITKTTFFKFNFKNNIIIKILEKKLKMKKLIKILPSIAIIVAGTFFSKTSFAMETANTTSDIIASPYFNINLTNNKTYKFFNESIEEYLLDFEFSATHILPSCEKTVQRIEGFWLRHHNLMDKANSLFKHFKTIVPKLKYYLKSANARSSMPSQPYSIRAQRFFDLYVQFTKNCESFNQQTQQLLSDIEKHIYADNDLV